jgi:hypothetical protein
MKKLKNLNPDCRLWIFQANRALTEKEIERVNSDLSFYMKRWNAHGQSLKSDFDLVEKIFLIICLDETYVGASGCSIDELISHIRKLGHDFNIEFLDRSLVCYRNREQTIQFMNRSKFKEFIKNGGKKEISKVFDITIQRLSDIDFLEKNFDDSWHAKAFMS